MKKLLVIGMGACFILLATGWAFKFWMPSHEKIHPALPPHSFYPFTLTESDARIPCLQAEIEGIPFLAKLDTGYEGVLSLPRHLLEQLTNKCHAGTVRFAGIRGKQYEASVFTIPELYIENLVLGDLPAKESHLEFERDTGLSTPTDLDPSDVIARIGWQAFLGTVIFIDLCKSVAICCDSLETLKEKGYPIEQFVSTDFFPGQHFMGFEANIGNQRVKCILDTGCTVNLIHTPSIASTTVGKELKCGEIDFANPLLSTMLSVGGCQLGSCLFHETQLPFGAEAIIGVEFLKTQRVCIDLINNKLLLCPVPEDDSLDPEATLSTL